ncbi:peptidoglycan-binding domain-containing protein [Marinobacter similis]|uniref:Peptidoglycan-binding protein n=1 Tax=Marinobacter similis TaxID=1420916 RepID=W5YN74_9GAMM|nr:peptidoglycan-binding domain-containing protein [Marinobacter similis]AHI27908.1 peptidoglycan-binding protein [Marinobacter similis]
MNSAKLSIVSKGLFLSAALAASSHAQAQTDSVNVIFAAENALYGAGYNVGRADGWMDKALQQAVRDYQARNGALKVSGSLDAETLSALGVSHGSGRAVSGNVVASKTDALAALGISETRTKLRPRHRPNPRLNLSAVCNPSHRFNPRAGPANRQNLLLRKRLPKWPPKPALPRQPK